MLRFILSSQDFKIGLKEITHDGDIIHSHGVWRMPQLYALLVKNKKYQNSQFSERKFFKRCSKCIEV